MLRNTILALLVLSLPLTFHDHAIAQSPPEPLPLTPEAATLHIDQVKDVPIVSTDLGGLRRQSAVKLRVDGGFNSGALALLGFEVALVSDTTLSRSTERLLHIRLTSDSDLQAFVAASSTLPGVLSSGPISVRTIQTNDPYYDPQQYAGMYLIDVQGFWDLLGKGSPEVGVAIIDTGINEVQDLQGRVDQGYNLLGQNTLTEDTIGHGTQIASIVAGQINNGVGVAGIAPRVHVVPVKACYGFGGSESGLALCDDIFTEAALFWVLGEALDGDIHVVNLSYGGPDFNEDEDELICQLLDFDVVVVAAAGNEGTSPVYFPASSPCAVAVGGVNTIGSRHPDSNWGSALDIVAPFTTYGVDENDVVQLAPGTSFSAPVISGIAALYRSGSFNELYWHDLFTYHQGNWNDQVGNGVPNWALDNMWHTACSVYDFNGDREINVTDAQMIAFRYGAFFGGLLYHKKFDLDPKEHDLDVDIQDIQKLFGRIDFTCLAT